MSVPRARGRRPLALALLLSSLAALAPGDALRTDTEVKVAFLYQFARYVEWPESPEPGGAFVVAILASDEVWDVAERTLAGKRANDVPLTLRRLSGPEGATEARIVFIGEGADRRLGEVLSSVAGRGVLTVSDSADFAARGGMIGFRTTDNRVRFDINVDEAAHSRLKISSEVLKLARLVETRLPR